MAAMPDIFPALPEIWLALAGMVLLLLGVYRGDRSTGLVSWLAVFSLIAAAAILLLHHQPVRAVTFSGMFVSDSFALFMKLLVLLGSGLSIILSQGYIAREEMHRFEFPVLILFATLGMLMMVSANDLIALYVGLELQSLALYVVAAFRRDAARSSEAGLKYFVLGALSSGMLLYGASLIYGFAGTTGFDALARLLEAGAPLGVTVGLVFVMAGLAFKISVVPFHMWTPDVYEGAPTPVTAFFAVAPKMAALALFIRLLIGPFGHLAEQWHQVVVFTSIASMVVGSLAALQQTNIKRLMAYSSIGNMGYALVGVAAGTEQGIQGVLIYMAVYLFMTVGTFAIILSMRQQGVMVEQISDLAGLSRSRPMMALAMAIFMFSMAGVPPLAGFLGKFYVFMAAVATGQYVLALVGLLASAISLYYYIRIVKVMYFDEAAAPFDHPGASVGVVTTVMAVLTFPVFIVFTGPILNGAALAAASLFPH